MEQEPQDGVTDDMLIVPGDLLLVYCGKYLGSRRIWINPYSRSDGLLFPGTACSTERERSR